MARYIDAEKLEKDGWSASRTYQQDAKTMVYETKKMTDFPTADVRENVHGRWVENGEYLGELWFKCSAWQKDMAVSTVMLKLIIAQFKV